MKSIILAAGAGNRLKPYTNEVPKCLVEIAGKSLLNWQIESLIEANISEINIVTGYKYKKIEELQDKRLNKIYFNSNYSSSNMVKSLLVAEELFNSDLLISYSDIIFSSKIVSNLLISKYKNAIIVDLDWYKLWSQRFENPLDDAETLIFDKNFNLLEIGKKAKKLNNIMAQYVGLMKFDKETLNFISKLNIGNKIEDNLYMTDLISLFLDYGINIKVIPIKRGWLEIDTVSDLSTYNEALLNNKASNIFNIFS
jgi:L-glutamine-phosphate cytidylyltransferase